MKILYITLENLSLHKGSVTHVKEIIGGLRMRGHLIGLIGSSSNLSEAADHFFNLEHRPGLIQKWFKLKRQPYLISSFYLLLFLWKVLPQYDLIYARDFHTVIVAILPRLIYRKRLVFEMNGIAHEEIRLRGTSIRNKIFAYLIEKAEGFASRHSNRIVTVTPQIADYLIQKFHSDKTKINLISNGVDTKKFYPIQDTNLLNEMRGKLGITPTEKIITFVGNLAPWQGVEFIIKAAPKVIKEMKSSKFLIIGDGILRGEYEREVDRLGLKPYFIFTGMVDYKQIPFYINLSDICVLPKQRLKSGYSPIKLYEYMACGKPIIASRVEGLELVENEGIGRLSDPEDVEAFAETLLELLKDNQKRIDMGQKGLIVARERFDWATKVAEIENVLTKVA